MGIPFVTLVGEKKLDDWLIICFANIVVNCTGNHWAIEVSTVVRFSSVCERFSYFPKFFGVAFCLTKRAPLFNGTHLTKTKWQISIGFKVSSNQLLKYSTYVG